MPIGVHDPSKVLGCDVAYFRRIYMYVVARLYANAALAKCVLPCVPERLKVVQSGVYLNQCLQNVYVTCLWTTADCCSSAFCVRRHLHEMMLSHVVHTSISSDGTSHPMPFALTDF